jgi:hypothetical protein
MRTHLLAATTGIAIVSTTYAEDKITTAPQGTYSITQHYAGSWMATLHFQDASRSEALLAADPDRYPWPALYYISPNDEWIFRVQKTGSGENTAFLYHVERNGRVWRMAQRLDDLAFAWLAREHVARERYFHTGIEFLAWDLQKQSVRFRLKGTPEEPGTQPLDRSFIYHLDSHQLTQ